MNELTLFDYGILPVNDAMALSAIKERIKIRLKRTAEDIIEIGLDLIIAKEKCGHGGFEKWLKAEFEMTQKSATRLMNVANTFGDYKSDNLSVLKISALYELAAPSMPEEVRTEIIERVENGETVDLKEIQRLKREAIETAQKLESAEAKVRFQALTVEAVEKQNNELRSRDQSLIDAKVAEAKAVLILENQQAIAENKRIAENAQSEIERLKREQEKAIEHGVKIELGKLETEMNQKRYQIEVNARELEELKKVRRELDVEVGALAVHKDAIKGIKIDLASLTMQFSDAFDTGTIPNEVTGDWSAIYDALSKLLTQMSEWRVDSALIGELVD